MTHVTFPKPEKRATTKRRNDRAEAAVKKSVRAQCVDRDGYCIVQTYLLGFTPGLLLVSTTLGACQGPSQWAHMHARRRSQTRGQAPEVRHDTRYSFMACQAHHDQYDGRQKPRLFITARTRKGADGPLTFRRATC